MRHIGTLIAALFVAPLAWILIAFGQGRSLEALDTAQSTGVYSSGTLVHSFEMLAGAGLLIGLLATLRFSPLGAVVTGLAYTVSYLLLVVAPEGTLRLFGHGFSLAGRHIDLAVPVRSGTTLILGAVMLVAILSIGRWRRWPRPDDQSFEEDADRPVGIDGLDLGPEPAARPKPPRRRAAEPEPEPEYSGLRENGFRPVPVSGVPSPWGRRAERARW
jgi:hypothetical protein